MIMKGEYQKNEAIREIDRKAFLAMSAATAAAFMLPGMAMSKAKGFPGDLMVGDLMDAFIKEVPGAPFPSTVDTLKAGDREIKIKGVVTSMFATIDVIRQAIAKDANFIIAHEPTYYNHADNTSWLEKDEIFLYKSSLLAQHKIAVWRNHDYIHRHRPDGVLSGVVSALGWNTYHSTGSHIINIPPLSLQQLIGHVKSHLGIQTLRYIGNPSHPCKRILLMPGAAGGQSQIAAISREKPDVLICGEVQEWETAEYVRDAQLKGQPVALIVLGHIPSEEPGSVFM
ncbi:MAG: NGG1p interacting factor NIF3, partial [Chitinophagaceae bacterium]